TFRMATTGHVTGCGFNTSSTMLKQDKNMLDLLKSIDGNFATIAKVFETIAETGLLGRLEAFFDTHEPPEPVTDTRFVVTDEAIENGDWMSRREAWLELCIVKSTLEEMIHSGKLTAYHKTCDRDKKRPYVWLKKSDVSELKKSYTLYKGKEKK